ncbi:DUF4876 domain-containing protein [Marinilabiliaceae bacterium JC017]|nr:DUF4876 domain-containing protein [Marinilabiliaceae bacterium JC017]
MLIYKYRVMNKVGIAMLVMFSILFFSCEKDDEISFSDVSVGLKLPKSLTKKKPVLNSAKLVMTNVNTGVETIEQLTTLQSPVVNVEDGLYNLLVTGELNCTTTDTKGKTINQTIKVRGVKENLEVVGGELDVDMSLFIFKESTGFVISEIFFARTKTPEGQIYNSGDQYFEIYNNSSEVLYADGLCIAQTALNSAQKMDKFKPDIRNVATPVSDVYRIPGSGKDYPVQPGESIVICDVAINHKTDNPNSFDLSKADFEWYDEKGNEVDVPEVTNMVKIASTSASSWRINMWGWQSYILFKMEDVTSKAFLKDYAYHYEYLFVHEDFRITMEFDAWKVPNSNIIDAVECSSRSGFKWKALDPSLDLTWTHSGDGNEETYGKSVKRKVSHVTADGRKVLLDTNDSAFDFIPTAVPSPFVIE